MIVLLCTAVIFSFLLFLGQILMLYNATAYILLPIFIIVLCFLKLVYRKPNCRSLEFKDIIVSLFITTLFNYVFLYINQPINVNVLSYWFLITYISILSFANSIRFKSLI